MPVDNVLSVAMILAGVAMIVPHRRMAAFYLARMLGIEEDKYNLSTQTLLGGIMFVIVGVLSLIL